MVTDGFVGFVEALLAFGALTGLALVLWALAEGAWIVWRRRMRPGPRDAWRGEAARRDASAESRSDFVGYCAICGAAIFRHHVWLAPAVPGAWPAHADCVDGCGRGWVRVDRGGGAA